MTTTNKETTMQIVTVKCFACKAPMLACRHVLPGPLCRKCRAFAESIASDEDIAREEAEQLDDLRRAALDHRGRP